MSAGFKSPLPWLGLSNETVVSQAGFRSALPAFGISGTADTVQAGFRTPLPGFNGGGNATAPVTQAGYRGMMGFWAGGAAAGTAEAIEMDGGPADGFYDKVRREDDELIECVIAMFTSGVIR